MFKNSCQKTQTPVRRKTCEINPLREINCSKKQRGCGVLHPHNPMVVMGWGGYGGVTHHILPVKWISSSVCVEPAIFATESLQINIGKL